MSLLLLCVPVQYLISAHWGSKLVDNERVEMLHGLVIKMARMVDNCASIQFWRDWVLDIGEQLKALRSRRWRGERDRRPLALKDDLGESSAMEVMQFRIDQGYFASSKHLRFPKTDDILFCVGQIVRHKLLGYRGVIVGWDPVAKAPESWLEKMHPEDKKYWRFMPNYAILVDKRDRSDPQMTYVPQENLEVLTKVEIQHPNTEDYFMAYTGKIYIPQQWLREIYPAD